MTINQDSASPSVDRDETRANFEEPFDDQRLLATINPALAGHGYRTTDYEQAEAAPQIAALTATPRPLVGRDLSITSCAGSSGGVFRCLLLTPAVVFEREAMSIVDDPIEDGVGKGDFADQVCQRSTGIWLVISVSATVAPSYNRQRNR